MVDLTLIQAAKRVGYSYTTLLKAVKSGALPAHQVDAPNNRKWWAVDSAVADAWAENKKRRRK